MGWPYSGIGPVLTRSPQALPCISNKTVRGIAVLRRTANFIRLCLAVVIQLEPYHTKPFSLKVVLDELVRQTTIHLTDFPVVIKIA